MIIFLYINAWSAPAVSAARHAVCFSQERSFKKITPKHLPIWNRTIPIILVPMYSILILYITNSGVFISIRRQNRDTSNWLRSWNRPFFPVLSRKPYGFNSSVCWNTLDSVRSSSVPAVFRKMLSVMHLPENTNPSSASTPVPWTSGLRNWKMRSAPYMPALWILPLWNTAGNADLDSKMNRWRFWSSVYPDLCTKIFSCQMLQVSATLTVLINGMILSMLPTVCYAW